MTMQLLVGWRNQRQARIRRPALTVLTAGLFLVGVTAAAQIGIGQARAFSGGVGGKNQPPVISNFSASNVSGNLWTFSGHVTDDQSVAGLIVNLGGLPSLQGITATVNSQGWFSVTVQLGTNESGTATAQTTDAGGLASNVAWTIVN
jgi:hypothetical protein